MIIYRCVRCLTERHKILFLRLINRRLYNSLHLKENFKASLTVKALEPSKFLVRNFSEAEKLSDHSPPLISVPELKFKDLNFNDPVSHDELVDKLQKCQSIEDQINTLISTLSLTPEDIQGRLSFCKTLEELFKPFFNNFRIHIYGSSINCFGFKGCDLDLSFETDGKEVDRHSFLESPDPPFVSEVLSGKATLQDIADLPPKEKLLFIHLVFLDYYKDSFDPPIFINSEVPLVRFHHDKFKLKCDLTYKNKVANSNTKMLYLYAKMDPRVSPIMMTVRYWAKHTELVGKGLLFNTYTFSLLVLFFLQSRNPPVIPSAEFMMSLADDFELEDINDKKTLDILNKIPPSKNTKTSVELLKEFFFFYLYFDFTRVICPLTSTSIPRDEFFSNPENKKFRMNSICVQDPMCLSHNVAEFPGFKSCKKLFSHLTEACHFFHDSTYNQPSESNPWGLMRLLEYPQKPASPSLISMRIPCGERSRAGQMANMIGEVMEKVLLVDCKVLQQNDVIDFLQKRDKIVHKQREILDGPNRNESNAIKKSISNKIDLPRESLLGQYQSWLDSGYELLMAAECLANKNVWLGRDFTQVGSSEDLEVMSWSDLLQTERQKSLQIVDWVAKINQQQNLGEKKPKTLAFLLECFAPRDWHGDIVVNCRPLKKTTFNPVFGIFLKEYLPKIVSRQ